MTLRLNGPALAIKDRYAGSWRQEGGLAPAKPGLFLAKIGGLL